MGKYIIYLLVNAMNKKLPSLISLQKMRTLILKYITKMHFCSNHSYLYQADITLGTHSDPRSAVCVR
jgi:hypothetical protein